MAELKNLGSISWQLVEQLAARLALLAGFFLSTLVLVFSSAIFAQVATQQAKLTAGDAAAGDQFGTIAAALMQTRAAETLMLGCEPEDFLSP